MEKSFYEYFKENMDALGLPAPKSLFETQNTAISTAATLINAIKISGGVASEITIIELAAWTTGLQKLAVIGAIGASFYVGAVIGSIAVAASNRLGDSIMTTSISDRSVNQVMAFASRNNLHLDGLDKILASNPEILNSSVTNRKKSITRIA